MHLHILHFYFVKLFFPKNPFFKNIFQKLFYHLIEHTSKNLFMQKKKKNENGQNVTYCIFTLWSRLMQSWFHFILCYKCFCTHCLLTLSKQDAIIHYIFISFTRYYHYIARLTDDVTWFFPLDSFHITHDTSVCVALLQQKVP